MKKLLKVLGIIVLLILIVLVILVASVMVNNHLEEKKYESIPKNFSIELDSSNDASGYSGGTKTYIDRENHKIYICKFYSDNFLNRKVYMEEKDITDEKIKMIEDIFETEEDFRDDQEYKEAHTFIYGAYVTDDWYTIVIDGKEKYIRSDKAQALYEFVGGTNYFRTFNFR